MKIEQLDNDGKPTGIIANLDDQVATTLLSLKKSKWRKPEEKQIKNSK